MTVAAEYPALVRRSNATDAIALEARRSLAEINSLRRALKAPPSLERTYNDAWHSDLTELFRLIGEATGAA